MEKAGFLPGLLALTANIHSVLLITICFRVNVVLVCFRSLVCLSIEILVRSYKFRWEVRHFCWGRRAIKVSKNALDCDDWWDRCRLIHTYTRIRAWERTSASYVIEIPRNYAKYTARRALPMVQWTTSSAFECVGAGVMWVVLAIWESRWNPTALISFIGYRFEFRVPAHRGHF